MATPDKLQYNFSLDDESKELIRQLVKAVGRIADAQAPKADVSFGDHGKRLIESDTVFLDKESVDRLRTTLEGAVTTTSPPTTTYPTEKQRADLRRILEGEGDHLLHDDGHEGEDIE